MHVKLKYIHFFSVGENGKIAKLKFEKKKFFAFFFCIFRAIEGEVTTKQSSFKVILKISVHGLFLPLFPGGRIYTWLFSSSETWDKSLLLTEWGLIHSKCQTGVVVAVDRPLERTEGD